MKERMEVTIYAELYTTSALAKMPVRLLTLLMNAGLSVYSRFRYIIVIIAFTDTSVIANP
jgi:hypothetical protein